MKQFQTFMESFGVKPRDLQMCEVGLKFNKGKLNTDWFTCLIIDKKIFRTDIVSAFAGLLTKDVGIVESIISKFESLKLLGLHGLYFGYEYGKPKEIYFDTSTDENNNTGMSFEKQKDNTIITNDWYAYTFNKFKKKYQKEIFRFDEISNSIDCAPRLIFIKNNGYSMSLSGKSNKICNIKHGLMNYLTCNQDNYNLTNDQLAKLNRYFTKRNNYTLAKIAFSKNDQSKLSIYMYGVYHPYLRKRVYFETNDAHNIVI